MKVDPKRSQVRSEGHEPVGAPGSGRRPPGRPRSASKREAILRTGTQLFLDKGAKAVSLDHVARAAGVSKRTIYLHFGSKAGLIDACTRWRSRERRLDGELLRADEDARQALTRLLRRLLLLVFDPDVIALCRMVQSQAVERPDVARQFFDNGPAQSHAVVADLLRRLNARGDLQLHDPDAAAWQLISLGLGQFRMRLMLNLIDRVPPDLFEVHLRDCIDAFLRIYGPDACRWRTNPAHLG